MRGERTRNLTDLDCLHLTPLACALKICGSPRGQQQGPTVMVRTKDGSDFSWGRVGVRRGRIQIVLYVELR